MSYLRQATARIFFMAALGESYWQGYVVDYWTRRYLRGPVSFESQDWEVT